MASMENIIRKQLLAITALLAFLPGCNGKQGEMAAAGLPEPKGTATNIQPPMPAQSPALRDLAAGEKVYRNTCSICHRIGQRGAPRLGDTENWVSRLAQGNETLYDRAINGYRGSKGSMPSRGSNAKLSDEEVKAAVDYMVWYSVPKSHGSFGSHLFSTKPKQFTIR